MTGTITASSPLSKPKVHRLPASVLAKPPQKREFPKRALFWAGAFLTAAALSLSMPSQPVVTAATMLPAVAVVSNRIQGSHALINEGTSMLPAAISDAQAAPALPLNDKGSTIMLRDHSSSIIGQMAKIPLENEHITEIKAINDIDNGAGRELLSIISKY